MKREEEKGKEETGIKHRVRKGVRSEKARPGKGGGYKRLEAWRILKAKQGKLKVREGN